MGQGAEANIKDKHGLSPAHYAASKGHLDVLQFFSSKGVDLEVEDPKGRTPLHYAALGDHPETLKYLISKSSWLEGQDYRDDTLLHLAARYGARYSSNAVTSTTCCGPHWDSIRHNVLVGSRRPCDVSRLAEISSANVTVSSCIMSHA